MDGGLCIVNISDPSNPHMEGRLTDTIGSTRGIDIVGNYVYTADAATIKSGKISGLSIYDVSKQNAPTFVGHINTNNAIGVRVVGGSAYVADGAEGVKIIDITNPKLPVLLGSVNTKYAVAVDVVDNYVYVADDIGGLKILDVTNPKSPFLVSNISTNNAKAVKIIGDYAYVADNGIGLKIFDISDQEVPFLVNTTILTFARGVSVFGGYAYMAAGLTGWDGIGVIKIDIPKCTRIKKSCKQNETVVFYTDDFNKIFDNTLTKIKITTLPNNGRLSLYGGTVNVNQEIVAADFEKLMFIPENNWFGKTNFLFSVANKDTHIESQIMVNIAVNEKSWIEKNALAVFPSVVAAVGLTTTSVTLLKMGKGKFHHRPPQKIQLVDPKNDVMLK